MYKMLSRTRIVRKIYLVNTTHKLVRTILLTNMELFIHRINIHILLIILFEIVAHNTK